MTELIDSFFRVPEHDSIVYYMFVIFTGSAILATLALYARQALVVGYIILGLIVGPSVLGYVQNVSLLKDISEIGITFLLFLLGLHLEPQDLLNTMRKSTLVTLLSSLAFMGATMLLASWFGFNFQDSLVIGAAMMFSSTIIGLKLLPTTVLHHRYTGQIIVGVLLFQDLIAIMLLLLIEGFSESDAPLYDIALMTLRLPLLIGFALLFERYIIITLIQRFDRIQEYIFLMTIGWCLGMAELAYMLKLSHEIGAFIGGVALASSPIARFIAENLKPVRDFFLILFFFSLGAGLDTQNLYDVMLFATVLAAMLLLIKPLVFKWLLQSLGEENRLSLEVGVRLGQISEFSLLIAVLAASSNVITESASYAIQAATVITFIISPYLIVLRYPTPIAVSDRLRRD